MTKAATTMTSTPFTRRSLAAVAAAVALCSVGAAHAQQQRVIHIIVPFGTGAVQDTVARAFNNELGAALNASAIVENRAGAGGTVGAAIVARAPADGTTLHNPDFAAVARAFGGHGETVAATEDFAPALHPCPRTPPGSRAAASCRYGFLAGPTQNAHVPAARRRPGRRPRAS